MTVWDRLQLLFPTCTADEIKTWARGDENSTKYNVHANLISRNQGGFWLNESGLRAAIDAMRPRPWHVVAQEALADWAMQQSQEFVVGRSETFIALRTLGDTDYNIWEDGRISNYLDSQADDFIAKHNEIASLLRASGLTQFKTYTLVEDTEQ